MYSPGVEPTLRQRLRAAGLDVDAITVIAKTGHRPDVPEALGDAWAAGWDGTAPDDLARLSQADRQHALARDTERFLQAPAHRALRAAHAARALNADLRAAGTLAVALADLLVAFEHDVLVPTTSPFTGKLKYATLTDLDVVTAKAVVEVSTQHDADGKVAQLAVLLGPVANPSGLPIYHYLPNVDPTSAPAAALRAAGSAGVYNAMVPLVRMLQALP